jgi:hypothetical protein
MERAMRLCETNGEKTGLRQVIFQQLNRPGYHILRVRAGNLYNLIVAKHSGIVCLMLHTNQ